MGGFLAEVDKQQQLKKEDEHLSTNDDEPFDVSVSLEDCMKKGKSMTPNLAEPVAQKSVCDTSKPSQMVSQSNVLKYACTDCD